MRYSRELKVGVTIVISIVVFILGVRYFADLPVFGGTYDLNTSFQDAEGLIAGANVRVRGVDVGKIDQVIFDPQNRIVNVHFHVDRTIRVPVGSSTAIRGFETFGSVHMELMLGPASNQVIPEGGYVPGSEEQGALGSVMNRAPQLTNRVDTVLVETQRALRQATIVLQAANTALLDPNSNLQQSLVELRRATAQMNRVMSTEQGRISRIMANLETSSGNLNQFSGDLTTFGRGGTMDTLAIAIQNMSQATRSLNRNLAGLEGSGDTLRVMLNRINQGEGSLGLFLRDPGLYNKFDSTAGAFNQLVNDFQSNPGRYLRQLKLFSLF